MYDMEQITEGEEAFTLVEVLVAVLILALLVAAAWATFAPQAREAQNAYVDIGLRTIDIELRSLARDSGSSINPASFMADVLGDEVTNPGCPSGGAYRSPIAECDLPDDDPNRYRLFSDTVSDPATVTMLRFGSCGVLTLDPTGREPGEITCCDAFDDSVNP